LSLVDQKHSTPAMNPNGHNIHYQPQEFQPAYSQEEQTLPLDQQHDPSHLPPQYTQHPQHMQYQPVYEADDSYYNNQYIQPSDLHAGHLHQQINGNLHDDNILVHANDNTEDALWDLIHTATPIDPQVSATNASLGLNDNVQHFPFIPPPESNFMENDLSALLGTEPDLHPSIDILQSVTKELLGKEHADADLLDSINQMSYPPYHQQQPQSQSRLGESQGNSTAIQSNYLRTHSSGHSTNYHPMHGSQNPVLRHQSQGQWENTNKSGGLLPYGRDGSKKSAYSSLSGSGGLLTSKRAYLTSILKNWFQSARRKVLANPASVIQGFFVLSFLFIPFLMTARIAMKSVSLSTEGDLELPNDISAVLTEYYGENSTVGWPHYVKEGLVPASFEEVVKLRSQVRPLNPIEDDGGGITIIAACANRGVQLSMTIKSWLRAYGVSELIFVDWTQRNSSARVAKTFGDDRVFVIRVNETDWTLSRAYNLAAKLARYEKLLKVDCDTVLLPDFFEAHRLLERNYFTLSWHDDPNVKKLRGVLYVTKENFWKVGGYDERLTEYGFEDLDLSRRFDFMELEKTEFDTNKLRHLSYEPAKPVVPIENQLHSDELIITPPSVDTRRNSMMIAMLEKWEDYRQKDATTFKYYIDSNQTSPLTVVFASVDKRTTKASELIDPKEYESISSKAKQTTLHDDCGVPWDLVSQISDDVYEGLPISDLNWLTFRLDPVNPDLKKLLVVVLSSEDSFTLSIGLTWAVSLAILQDRTLVLTFTSDTSDALRPSHFIDLEKSRARLFKFSGFDVRFAYGGTWKCKTNLELCLEYDSAYQGFEEVVTHSTVEAITLNPVRHSIVHLSKFEEVDIPLDILPSKVERHVFSAWMPTKAIKSMVRKAGDMKDVTAVYISRDHPPDNLGQWLDVIIANMKQLAGAGENPESVPLLVCGPMDSLVTQANEYVKSRGFKIVDHIPQESDALSSEVSSPFNQMVELELMLRCRRIYLDPFHPTEMKALMRYTLTWRKLNMPTLPMDLRRQYSNAYRKLVKVPRNLHFFAYEFKAW